MNKFAGLLTATALVAAPVVAMAQHSGHGTHGAMIGRAGRGFGYHGRYWGWAGPWWGWWGPWGWPYYCYDYYWPSYSCDYWWGYPPPPPPGTPDYPPPPSGTQPSAEGNVCGNWVWRSDEHRYQWTTSPCGPATATPPAPHQG